MYQIVSEEPYHSDALQRWSYFHTGMKSKHVEFQRLILTLLTFSFFFSPLLSDHDASWFNSRPGSVPWDGVKMRLNNTFETLENGIIWGVVK